MSEVTKEDINRLHGRIDKLVEGNEKTAVDIAVIKTKLEDLDIPEQPCQFFREHLQNHKETKSLWQKPLVRTAIDLVKMGIVFIVGWFWAKRS